MKLHCRCSGILVWHGSVLVNPLHRWLNIRLSFICGVQFRPAEKLGCTYLLKIWTAIYISKSLIIIYIPMQTMYTDVSARSFNMITTLNTLQEMFVMILRWSFGVVFCNGHRIALTSIQLRIFGHILSAMLKKGLKGWWRKKKSVTQEVFIALVKEEWEKIPDELILTNISSMPRRIQACIDAEGGHTRYWLFRYIKPYFCTFWKCIFCFTFCLKFLLFLNKTVRHYFWRGL